MKKEIEEQFDKKFTDYPGGVYLKEKPVRKEDILFFIEKLIQQERERIIGEIRNLPRSDDTPKFQAGEENTISRIIDIIETLNQ